MVASLHIDCNNDMVGGEGLEVCSRALKLSVQEEGKGLGRPFGTQDTLIESISKNSNHCLSNLREHKSVGEWSKYIVTLERIY